MYGSRGARRRERTRLRAELQQSAVLLLAARPSPVVVGGGSRIRTCMGLFPVKWVFSVYCQFFVRSGKGRSSSRRLRLGSRSARKGSRDRNASTAWRLAALAALVFRSALTPEHAEGRCTARGPSLRSSGV